LRTAHPTMTDQIGQGIDEQAFKPTGVIPHVFRVTLPRQEMDPSYTLMGETTQCANQTGGCAVQD